MPFNKFIFSTLTCMILLFIADPCFSQENIQTAMLSEVNQLRQSGCKCGGVTMPPVPDLVWNDKLELAADRHVKDIYKNKLTGHIGSDGSEPADRITKAGYQWISCGENVAYGFHSVKDVVNGWKTSPNHCQSMMDADFKEMGAARKESFWVLDLGSPDLQSN